MCGRWYLPLFPFRDGFFNQPGELLLFPADYTEVVQSGGMTCGVAVVIDGEGGF